MNKLLFLIFVITFLAGCIQSSTSLVTIPQQSSEDFSAEVEIRNYTFSPATLTIRKGEGVKFTNYDAVPHTATDHNSFDTGLLNQGQSKVITFNNIGTYEYHCHPHPYMQAKIIVE